MIGQSHTGFRAHIPKSKYKLHLCDQDLAYAHSVYGQNKLPK